MTWPARMSDHIPRELDAAEQAYLCSIAPLVRERLKRLDDSDDMTAYFFGELAPEYDGAILVQKGMDTEGTHAALLAAADALAKQTTDDDFGHERLEALMGDVGQQLELSRRQFFGLLRTASTGQKRIAAPV